MCCPYAIHIFVLTKNTHAQKVHLFHVERSFPRSDRKAFTEFDSFDKQMRSHGKCAITTKKKKKKKEEGKIARATSTNWILRVTILRARELI